ncbi:MAG: recombination protein RecR [Bacteroidia bacterium]|nr:recombination protein RecR [Bacteroidia bacterium]
MHFSSKTLEIAVNELSGFPGVGKRSALRMVLHLLKRSPEDVKLLSDAIIRLKTDLKQCTECGNASDYDLCAICSSVNRNHALICVVEDLQDVMAIENTAQFNGVYHLLGGLISPIDGIGPETLTIDKLVTRVAKNDAVEVIIALSANMEGDTTMFYISRKLKDSNVKVSVISRGISIGAELDFADEITLGRSIINRIPYQA